MIEAHGMCFLNSKVKLTLLKARLEPLFSFIAGTTKQFKKVLNSMPSVIIKYYVYYNK